MEKNKDTALRSAMRINESEDACSIDFVTRTMERVAQRAQRKQRQSRVVLMLVGIAGLLLCVIGFGVWRYSNAVVYDAIDVEWTPLSTMLLICGAVVLLLDNIVRVILHRSHKNIKSRQ